MQLSHQASRFKSKAFPIIVIADGIQSPANIGGLFRICEAFGVARIIFWNSAPDFSSTRLKRTARDTINKVPYSICEDVISEIEILKNKKYKIFALEITADSIAIEDIQREKDQNTVLIIGNERHGISQPLLNTSDQEIHIRMYGNNSSMNVIQATAIALHSLTKV
ncbi:TrmH family RNA methyltransferase [Constantimarinum furrinae]|uniref:SpoU rRNA methylase family protein n=1 Tax=Constantimarinum furrinae TaxID=2562285 RepID=A0A7G8PWV1_9FLAO|nr:TrmH family RNA methyltransferase [Constantimarinum furrinae]QNJ98817.1 SpoU rRNA methylase family protein [Constantimarinum furrinae]